MAHGAPARLQKRHKDVFPRDDGEGNSSGLQFSGFPQRAKSSQNAEIFPTFTSTSATESSTSTSSSHTSTQTTTSSSSSSTSSTSSVRSTTTTSSTSTSSSSTSSVITSTSSSSSSSSSSSPSSVASHTTVSFTAQSFAPVVQTTIGDLATTPFVVGPSTLTTDSQTTLPTETTQSSSAKGFLENKAAMAGTFSVVGLVGLGVLLVVLFTLWKKRSSFRPRAALMRDDESFKNFTMVEPEKAESSNGHESFYSHGDHTNTDLNSQTPMDPFATSGPVYPATAHHGSTQEQANPFADSNTSYNYPSHQSSQHSLGDQYLGYYATTTDLPPPPTRKVLARTSVQPSIDSFYGAAY